MLMGIFTFTKKITNLVEFLSTFPEKSKTLKKISDNPSIISFQRTMKVKFVLNKQNIFFSYVTYSGNMVHVLLIHKL